MKMIINPPPIAAISLKLEEIMPDPRNRKEHSPAKIKGLAQTIEAEGLLQPILVVPLLPGEAPKDSGARYMIVAGERRWRAFGLLKRPTIPAFVLAAPAAGRDLASSARKRLVENLQREDLTPIERARQFRELAVEHKMTQAAIAELAGCSQPAVANALALLDLPATVQAHVQAGDLSEAHGKTLVRFARWPKVCEQMAGYAIKRGDPSKDLERDPIPYRYELERLKLIVDIPTASWNETAYAIPEACRRDPDFVQTRSDGGWYCMVPAKWYPERDRQDAARKAKAQAEERKAATAAKTGKPTKEQLQRRQKLQANKVNRATVAERMAAAEQRLAAAKDLDAAAVRVIVHEFLDGIAYNRPNEAQIERAAAAIGLAPPKRRELGDPANLAKYRPADLIRLTAAAIARSHGEHALQFAGAPSDCLDHLAGKPKAKEAKDSVTVTVTAYGNDNVARAHSAQAACTSGPAEAARRAAAKYLGCQEDLVGLTTVRTGDTNGVDYVYRASRKAAKGKGRP